MYSIEMISVLLLILLFEGFITIAVEILTMRQLLPFFGGSVVITSIIIGVFLLFLALGYWRGGAYKQDYLKKISNNFIAALLCIGIGLSYSFISLFFFLTVLKIGMPFQLSLTLYLLLVLAPIVYLLGQTIPLTTNLFNQGHRVSHISGRALFLSTVGSFLGALITSLILFQSVGVAWTVVINCFLLFVLIIRLQADTGLRWTTVLLLCVALYFIKIINVDMEKVLFQRTNAYANYQVKQQDDALILEMNLSNNSRLTPQKEGFVYIEFLRDLLFKQLKLRHKKILVIGAGGFSFTAAGTESNDVLYIDIDPYIRKFAEAWFLKHSINGRFIGEDARYYLNKSIEQYDVIISDAYSNQLSIPPALLTTDYFQQLSNHLRESGLLVVNIIASPLFNNDYTRRVHNTIQRIFPFCLTIPFGWQQPSNLIYLCTKQPHDKSIYTDNLTTSTFDYFNIAS